MAGRVLVTGAAGRIGSAVLDLLDRRGLPATALVLEDPGDLPADRVVVGDATDPDTVQKAVEGATAVIHLAALPTPLLGTPFEVFGGNTLATFTVLEQAGRAGVRHAAIASSYGANGLPWRASPGQPAYVPIDEELPTQVEDPYGLSKLTDELTAQMMARRYGMSVVALRYPFIGGVGDRLTTHARAIAEDPGRGAHDLWTYLDVRDAAIAALLALEVGGAGAHVVQLAAPLTLAPYPTEDLLRRYHPRAERRRAFPGRTAPIDTSRAERLLGFAPSYVLEIEERALRGDVE